MKAKSESTIKKGRRNFLKEYSQSLTTSKFANSADCDVAHHIREMVTLYPLCSSPHLEDDFTTQFHLKDILLFHWAVDTLLDFIPRKKLNKLRKRLTGLEKSLYH